MESYISYVSGGQTYKIPTSLSFNEKGDDDNTIAIKVYLAVSGDRTDKLENGLIQKVLSEQEKAQLDDSAILEWYKTSDIEFFDANANKKLKMKHMSDFMGNYEIE